MLERIGTADSRLKHHWLTTNGDWEEVVETRPVPITAQAELALEMFWYIGAYCAVLGTVDALVFTGGIGENSAEVRARSCRGLSALGISIDERKNSVATGVLATIQTGESRVAILVIPTAEEREIAHPSNLKMPGNE